MNVIVDEELLEEARRASGEKTYSGTINKALAELARLERLDRGLRRLQEFGDDYFMPGYLEMLDAEEANQRVAANERRVLKKAARRGTR